VAHLPIKVHVSAASRHQPRVESATCTPNTHSHHLHRPGHCVGRFELAIYSVTILLSPTSPLSRRHCRFLRIDIQFTEPGRSQCRRCRRRRRSIRRDVAGDVSVGLLAHTCMLSCPTATQRRQINSDFIRYRIVGISRRHCRPRLTRRIVRPPRSRLLADNRRSRVCDSVCVCVCVC